MKKRSKKVKKKASPKRDTVPVRMKGEMLATVERNPAKETVRLVPDVLEVLEPLTVDELVLLRDYPYDKPGRFPKDDADYPLALELIERKLFEYDPTARAMGQLVVRVTERGARLAKPLSQNAVKKIIEELRLMMCRMVRSLDDVQFYIYRLEERLLVEHAIDDMFGASFSINVENVLEFAKEFRAHCKEIVRQFETARIALRNGRSTIVPFGPKVD